MGIIVNGCVGMRVYLIGVIYVIGIKLYSMSLRKEITCPNVKHLTGGEFTENLLRFSVNPTLLDYWKSRDQ